MINLQNSYCIDPLHPKTSFHILHTPLNQFSLLLTKRIHLILFILMTLMNDLAELW